MKDNLTQIVCVLDRSGSMSHLTSDTIGGYNTFIEKQRKDPGEAWVTTVLFDNQYEVLHDAADIKTLPPITGREYYARGMTALYDAVGRTINEVGNKLESLPERERPSKVIAVIITDGLENASKEYGKDRVKEMITLRTERYGWQFIFMGANIDSAAEAQKIGIAAQFSMDYDVSDAGTAAVYTSADRAVRQMRSTGKVNQSWREDEKRNQ